MMARPVVMVSSLTEQWEPSGWSFAGIPFKAFVVHLLSLDYIMVEG